MSSGGRGSRGRSSSRSGRGGGRSITRSSTASPDVKDSPQSSEQKITKFLHEDIITVGEAPKPGEIDPSDSKMWIYPDKDTFIPVVQTIRRIPSVIQSKYDRPMYNWRTTPLEVRDMWFEEWKKPFKWLPTHNSKIMDNWNKRCSDRLRTTMYKIRTVNVPRGKKPAWIPAPIFEQLKEAWNADTSKQKQHISKVNQASVKSTTHGCDNILTSEHRRQMEDYNKLKQAWSSQGSTNVADDGAEEISPENDTTLRLDAVDGKSKKGHVSSIGQELICRCEKDRANMLEIINAQQKRIDQLEELVRRFVPGRSTSKGDNLPNVGVSSHSVNDKDD